MKILDLPLKKEWYEMIESGVKTEEYREIKPYWIRRFCFSFKTNECNCKKEECKECFINKNILKTFPYYPYTHIRFRYGYTRRTMLFELVNITAGKGNTEWGAPKDKDVFILKLGKKITTT